MFVSISQAVLDLKNASARDGRGSEEEGLGLVKGKRKKEGHVIGLRHEEASRW